MSAQELIAVIPKNSQEEIRVALDEFKGHRLCHVRTYLLAINGQDLPDPRPTKKGIAIKADRLPELIAALETACGVEGIELPAERARGQAI